ncbi:MAG: hypothetical protein L0177_05275 [Chloroflexi bacterium]|nr:hypothetical protein [Chloroflexota bacterium]
MEKSGVWLLKLGALALGIAGWVTYLLIWLGVRLFGEVTLTFGEWGPSWLMWIEHWVEPLVLVAWLAFLGWAFWHEFTTPRQHRDSKQTLLTPPSRSGRWKWRPSSPLVAGPIRHYQLCSATRGAQRSLLRFSSRETA